jgi:hypothetical protein
MLTMYVQAHPHLVVNGEVYCPFVNAPQDNTYPDGGCYQWPGTDYNATGLTPGTLSAVGNSLGLVGQYGEQVLFSANLFGSTFPGFIFNCTAGLELITPSGTGLVTPGLFNGTMYATYNGTTNTSFFSA